MNNQREGGDLRWQVAAVGLQKQPSLSLQKQMRLCRDHMGGNEIQ